VAELLVPEAIENPFRAHYRRLILGSALHTAEAELDRLRSTGHRRRAQRVDRVAGTLRELTGEPVAGSLPAPAAEVRFGLSLRSIARVAWVAAASFLLADVVRFGVHSWATAGADLALILVTIAWFLVSIGDLLAAPEPRSKQLELFDL
jgi:hypothetical protein